MAAFLKSAFKFLAMWLLAMVIIAVLLPLMLLALLLVVSVVGEMAEQYGSWVWWVSMLLFFSLAITIASRSPSTNCPRNT